VLVETEEEEGSSFAASEHIAEDVAFVATVVAAVVLVALPVASAALPAASVAALPVASVVALIAASAVAAKVVIASALLLDLWALHRVLEVLQEQQAEPQQQEPQQVETGHDAPLQVESLA